MKKNCLYNTLKKGQGRFSVRRMSLFFVLLMILSFGGSTQDVYARSNAFFQGEGTAETPYLIQNVEDLKTFRDMVNQGETFKDCYFYQTNNLDLLGIDWIPIGVYESGNYFYGVYNGGGHYIENLHINPRTDNGTSNQGFFGQLGGIVLNLGIESGEITGTCIGSVASHCAPDSKPAIISCYSKANLYGTRAGGIADNFSGGMIINCWFGGKLEGDSVSGIVSYSGILINCLSSDEKNINPENPAIEIYSPDEDLDFNEGVNENTLWVTYASFFVNPEEIALLELNDHGAVFSGSTIQNEEIKFKGAGTKDDPYLIEDYEDLCLLRNMVNKGESYEGIYFKQTDDITMETDDWVPIGNANSGNYFFGVYDGAGYKIRNLTIKRYGNYYFSERGLFGYLGGVVVNLGLENVNISAERSAAFASGAAGNFRTAAIINCYATGEICGDWAGGIAYDFSGGAVVNCISDVELVFPGDASDEEMDVYEAYYRGGIVGISSDTKVYSCFTTWNQVMPEAFRTATSDTLSNDEMHSASFEKKLNIRTGLAQELFGNYYNVKLMQWDMIDESGIVFTNSDRYIKIFDMINEYLMPVLLMPIIVWTVLKMYKGGSKKEFKENEGKLIALSIISGVVSMFVDCAMLSKFQDVRTFGNILFVILINGLFVSTAVIILKNKKLRINKLDAWIPLICIMLILFVLEMLQFNVTPRYDAALYYGSFVRGADLFKVDFFTYIGAFACWRWAQGSALLLAPLEFLFPGQMIGVYIANIVITELTLVILYKFFSEEFRQISPICAALSSFMLVLCPYQLGMFTYLCFDSHLVYYAIWMLYAYKKKNNILISFCGFLLCFTKISGMIFYVVFLITATVIEVLTEYRGKLLMRISEWWKWGKCILWMFPAILYLPLMVWGKIFVIQHFQGASVQSVFARKSLVSLENTLLQTGVFGFRWMFLALIIVTAIICIKKPERIFRILSKEGLRINLAVIMGGVFVFLMLMLYNSNAECPRYTALMNVVYVLLTPVCISVLFKTDKLKSLLLFLMTVLMLVQTYWTIDPSIIWYQEALGTGEKQLYSLTIEESEDSPEYGCVGDVYAYNVEYNYYNDLINDVMKEINPSETDEFYILDVDDYEFHLNGLQYKIYWNDRLGKMTYDGKDNDSILLQEYSITTEELQYEAQYSTWLGNEFYIVVPSRVDESVALNCLEENGYLLEEQYHPSNLYGSFSVYHFIK